MTMFYLLSIVLFVMAWAIANPQDAMDIIAGLRHHFRRNIIQRVGNQAVHELVQQLRTEARQMGISTEIGDQVIDEHRREIVDRLGNKFARELIDD